MAEQLKKDGWSFASHTWGHLNMTQASLEDVKKDNELWQQEVAPILGKTNILIYPFGADIIRYGFLSKCSDQYRWHSFSI